MSALGEVMSLLVTVISPVGSGMTTVLETERSKDGTTTDRETERIPVLVVISVLVAVMEPEVVESAAM